MQKTLATLTVAAILAIPTAALAQDQGADPASLVNQASVLLAQAEDQNGLGTTAGQGSEQSGPWTDMRYDNIEGGGNQ
jgi:hypothetical protein